MIISDVYYQIPQSRNLLSWKIVVFVMAPLGRAKHLEAGWNTQQLSPNIENLIPTVLGGGLKPVELTE